MPRWYVLIEAARHLGVPPWELETRPTEWLEYALTHRELDSWARAKRESEGS